MSYKISENGGGWLVSFLLLGFLNFVESLLIAEILNYVADFIVLECCFCLAYSRNFSMFEIWANLTAL